MAKENGLSGAAVSGKAASVGNPFGPQRTVLLVFVRRGRALVLIQVDLAPLPSTQTVHGAA